MATRTDASFWIFVAVLVVLHLAIHIALGHGADKPDLIAAAVLLAARRLSGPRAASLGLGLGLIADSFALITFGASAVALVVVAWLGSRTRDLFEGASLAFIGFYLFLGKLVADAVYQLAASLVGEAADWGTLLTDSPLRALYTAIAGVLALAAYRALVGERRGR